MLLSSVNGLGPHTPLLWSPAPINVEMICQHMTICSGLNCFSMGFQTEHLQCEWNSKLWVVYIFWFQLFGFIRVPHISFELLLFSFFFNPVHNEARSHIPSVAWFCSEFNLFKMKECSLLALIVLSMRYFETLYSLQNSCLWCSVGLQAA